MTNTAEQWMSLLAAARDASKTMADFADNLDRITQITSMGEMDTQSYVDQWLRVYGGTQS